MKLPHQWAKTDHLEGDAPRLATDSAETFYTPRNRVASIREWPANRSRFLGPSGDGIRFSTQKISERQGLCIGYRLSALKKVVANRWLDRLHPVLVDALRSAEPMPSADQAWVRAWGEIQTLTCCARPTSSR